ncbi:hypothetical protein [Halalkalibacter krulwichiae]|uniref:Uncharacterized protein n=1 Tax=Halalkalibacter krulwichiae TaxID=199441 RepID=A0A1X9M8A0_9BACI|nr:hypothetical protein [Halalkalibacter krulwichiae]ARK28820.1 hypothetical protein BkAM31D_02550 [Halalkalibacter krulwichiae]
MNDKYIRKPIVFNRRSAWHMEIYTRIQGESDNFSGYVMSILKEHFDRKPRLEKSHYAESKTIDKEIERNGKEHPTLEVQQEIIENITLPKLFRP